MKKIYKLALLMFLANTAVLAQDSQLITYHGQFRTLLSDNRLSGNVLQGDTVSPRRGALGSMYLDLGINVKPNEDFKILAEFRMRNVIGENGQTQVGGGVTLTNTNTLIDTRMIFRQVRAEGNIKKIVQYQIGDIDLGLTKYTLFNNNETYHTFEGDIYKERRVIAHYENFQNGNLWRLQGVSAKTQINVRGPIRRIDANIFGVRTRINNAEAIPDRLMVGGKLEIMQSKYLTLGANWISMFDVPGSTYDSLNIAYNYNNQVLTGIYKITPVNSAKLELNVLGEIGFSDNRYYVGSLDSTSHKDDYFIDAGVRANYKPGKIQLTASYINVGYDFTSPGAQTLRLRPLAAPYFLPMILNNTTNRYSTVYDRYSDERIYNQRIYSGLMTFLPIYGNVLPYGAATPNRMGLVFDLERALDTAQVLSFQLGGAMLSEVVPEGDLATQQLRKFTQLKGGIAFNLSKLIGFNKAIVLSGGGRYENTSRGGSAAVNYTSILADGGLTLEVFRKFYLLGGMKYLQGKGTEVLTYHDQFGSVGGYAPYQLNMDQIVYSGGIKLSLFKNSFAGLEYNSLKVTLKDTPALNHTINNLFLNFTLRF